MIKRKLSIIAAYIEFYVMGIIDQEEYETRRFGK